MTEDGTGKPKFELCNLLDVEVDPVTLFTAGDKRCFNKS